MNNLYIALSTHHLKYCENIAQHNAGDNNILITSRHFEINFNRFDRIIYLSNTAYNQSDSFFSKLSAIIKKTSSYHKVVDEIQDLKNAENIVLYYSSLEDILSNYLLFAFSKNMKGVIIEDGVLNYYQHTLNDVSSLNFTLKRIISFFYGLRLKSYDGHTSGIDYKRVKYQLVRAPEHSIKPKKSKLLPLEKVSPFSLNENILIVGQEPYGNLFSSTIYLNKLLKLIEVIKSDSNFNNGKSIFYKSHRHGPRVDIETVKAAFLENKFYYIHEEISMEDLYFNKIKCKNIYTFDSSAVFSIYSDAPDEIKNKLNITVMPFHKSDLNPLFSKLNFTIIKNDI